MSRARREDGPSIGVSWGDSGDSSPSGCCLSRVIRSLVAALVEARARASAGSEARADTGLDNLGLFAEVKPNVCGQSLPITRTLPVMQSLVALASTESATQGVNVATLTPGRTENM
jgi:hypothetical protein